MFDIKPDSLNLVWITDDEQRLEEDQEDESEGPQPTPYNPLIFWPAALCDMTATSIQYIALTLTYASSFQMLRGKTKHYTYFQRVGCDRFLGRTYAPRTFRCRCARTRVRTCNLRWLHLLWPMHPPFKCLEVKLNIYFLYACFISCVVSFFR